MGPITIIAYCVGNDADAATENALDGFFSPLEPTEQDLAIVNSTNGKIFKIKVTIEAIEEVLLGGKSNQSA